MEQGKLAGLTVKQANEFGLTTRNDIRIVQHQLRKIGLLQQKGSRFVKVA